MAQPPSHTSDHLQTAADDPDASADALSPWLLVWTIFVAKAGTLGIIIWAARTPESGLLVLLTSLPWIVLAVALAAGPILFRRRLHRVRARREQLQRQEWMVPDRAPSGAGHTTPAHRR